jgi:hypothetical protein
VRQSHESFFLQLEKQASNCFIIINYHKMSLSTVFAVIENLSIIFLVLITKPLLGKFLNDNTPVFFRTVENYQSPYYRLNCVTNYLTYRFTPTAFPGKQMTFVLLRTKNVSSLSSSRINSQQMKFSRPPNKLLRTIPYVRPFRINICEQDCRSPRGR